MAQSAELEELPQIPNEPPAQNVTLAPAGSSAIEHKIMIHKGLEKLALAVSWVYQSFQI